MVKPFGWAYLGAGHIAHATAEAILRSGHHRIVSVWNRHPEKAITFAKTFGATAFPTVEEAILAPEVEGVYLATAHDAHLPLAIQAITLGKPLLIEKPITVNHHQTQALFDLATRQQIYVVEAMWTWFNLTAKQVQSWIQEGKLGKITKVKATYGYDFRNVPLSSRLRNPLHAGGALLDIGIYPIHYCYQLFGNPTHLHCQAILQDGVDMRDHIMLTYDGFQADLTIAFDETLPEEFVIEGTLGTILVPQFHMASEATLMTREGTTRYVDPTFQAKLGVPQFWANQFDWVAKEIRAGLTQSQWITHSMSLAVMNLLDACRQNIGLRYPFESE